MAKFKGYRTFFVGVEEFFFHGFQHKFCEFTGIEGKDYELEQFLCSNSEFIETEFNILYRPGNLSNQLSGKITSAAAVKIYSFHEDMYYKQGNDPWINLIYAKLKDFEYSKETESFIGGINAILAKHEELVRMQAENLCKGYNKAVLQQLKEEITSVYNSMGTATKDKSKEYMARILLMMLTYFVANGNDFIHLGKERPVNDHICNAYKALIPAVNDVVTDFEVGLTADVNYNGKCEKLEEVISKKHGNIFIVGEGGAGKSTMMLSAANNLSALGVPCVFIHAREADNFSSFDKTKDCFILNKILCIFTEWLNKDETADPYNLCNKILSDKLGAGRVVVFIDAINEASPASQQTLINQILQLSQTTGKIKFVVSSRHSTPPLKHFAEVKVNPVDPLKFLSEEKANAFKLLGSTEKKTFSNPLYIKIIAENNNVELKISALLSKKYQREIEKAKKNAIVDNWVITDFICEFTYHMFSEHGGPMVFSLEQLKDYVEQSRLVHSYEYIKNQLALIFPLKDSCFFYNHETERDYLLAKYISVQFENTCSIYETCTELFCGVKYPEFVLVLLKEMLQNKKNEIFKSLRQKNCGEEFYSHKVALTTATAVEIFKDSKQLRGLNLTKTHIAHLLKNTNFADSFMHQGTLMGNSINSAIFKICADDKFIYAIGRGIINVFDHDFCEKASVAFKSGTNVISCRQNSSTIVFADKDGKCFVFDKHMFAVKRLLEEKAVSVELFEFFDQSGFLIGLDNGRFAIVDDEALKSEIISAYYGKYIVPLDKYDDYEYIYITSDGDIHRFNTENNTTYILWQFDCVYKNRADASDFKGLKVKSALKITEGCYILEFYKKGFTLLCEVNINTAGWQVVYVAASGDAAEAEASKAAYNIDYNKINDIVFYNGALFTATNSGFVNVFVKDDTDNWIFMPKNTVDYTAYSHNPGDGVEAVCALNRSTLLFTSTTRSIYQANYIIKNKEFRYTITNTVSGTNTGIRRIVKSKDGQKLYAFCFNHSVVVYTRSENGRFVFNQKIDTDNGWAWAGCEDDWCNLYIACDEKIFVHCDGKTEILKEFDAKVENLLFSPAKGRKKAMLFAAVGHRIEQFVFTEKTAAYKGRINVGKENDRYRPMAFAICKDSISENEEIAVACSSGNNTDGLYEPASIFKLEHGGLVRNFFKNDMLQGWFRSVEYDEKSGYYVCAGLKYGENNVAVAFNHKEKQIYILAGHDGIVSDARITEIKDDMLRIVTTAYDGTVNLYSISVKKSKDKSDNRKFTVVKPFKSISIPNCQLFNIVTDGNDLLVCSLNGKIFRCHNCMDENSDLYSVEAENHNIFVTDSDFSKTVGIDGLKNILETFNNKI